PTPRISPLSLHDALPILRSIVVDKIASVALGCDLAREIRIDSKIPCEEGVLIAVEVLNSKSSYNVLELTSGRMAQVKRGDVIVGDRKSTRLNSSHVKISY